MPPQAEMLEEDVLACQFSCWYEHFRREKVTFKSEIITLPEEFVDFLMADGIRVPTDRPDDASDGSFEEAQDAGDSDSDSGLDASELSCYDGLRTRVADAIAKLDGGALPKLNWSAPKDAQWVHSTLQCNTPQEVFTLLKASDFVSHDLCHCFDHCAPGGRRRPDEFTLVLRKWYDLKEAGEFRCFVRDSTMVAASQRQTSVCFPHLAQPAEREALADVIQEFFEGYVLRGFSLTRFVFDVYVGPAPRRRVWLVDFSPWGPSTEPCLFDWDELSELAAPAQLEGAQRARFELRVADSEADCRSKLSRYHGLPVELAQLGLGEGLEELIQKADAVLEQKVSA